jgi:hypothetical protein
MGAFVTSRPPIWMVPLSSGTSPEIARNVVVLPTALGPNNTKKQPSGTSRLKRSRARTEL